MKHITPLIYWTMLSSVTVHDVTKLLTLLYLQVCPQYPVSLSWNQAVPNLDNDGLGLLQVSPTPEPSEMGVYNDHDSSWPQVNIIKIKFKTSKIVSVNKFFLSNLFHSFHNF